jgi:hypothetical protein
MCVWFGLIHTDVMAIGVGQLCAGIFRLIFGLPISYGVHSCFCRLSLSDYLYVGLDVLIWSYVYIHSSPWWWCFAAAVLSELIVLLEPTDTTSPFTSGTING